LVVDRHLGLDRERLEPPLRRHALGQRLRQFERAAQRLLDRIGDAVARRSSSSSRSNSREDRDGVERAGIGGGEDLRVDDIGAGHGTGAGR